MTVASAIGYIALLNEPNAKVQARALQSLLAMVDTNWHEMVDSLQHLSELASTTSSVERQQAALLCSRLCFHLGQMERSVEFALKAGDLFEAAVNDKNNNDYVNVILAKAVDKYIEGKREQAEAEPLLQALVERMVTRCLENGEYIQVIGIGMECRRLDILEAAIKAPKLDDERLSLVYYIMELSVKLPFTFQQELLSFCVSILKQCPTPDHVTIADCLVMLRDQNSLIKLIEQLIADSQFSVALQICFNINDNADQSLRQLILDTIKGDSEFRAALSGESANRLRLSMLSRSVASDLLILERTKTLFSPGNTMFHSAVCLSNALMHAGTTNDDFVRKNLEWLSMASNWTKYTAVSALGQIYRGHCEQSLSLLSQYLPKDGVVGSEYSEGGALFALGLTHAGHPNYQSIMDVLLKSITAPGEDEVRKHGGCFGIGAAGFATRHSQAVEECKSVLFQDNAVSGEGAAVGLGLLMFGSVDEELAQELLSFGRATKHDKIKRSVAIAVAMIMFKSAEKAQSLIESLLAEQEGWLRFCAMWTVALAFVGTGHRRALSLLLTTAVTDSDGDVRRVAVLGQAFVLTGQDPKELPEMVRLMLESYNPNLRFGALIALGIGFAGTGSVDALDMIDGLMRSDKVDFVRQAAMMSAAMVLCQQPAERQAPLRTHLERIVSTKHEEALAKFGAVLAQGILDCGGRNQIISLTCPNGLVNPISVAGMAMFCQFWFWYPNINFLSLCMTPSALIAVTCTGQVPKMTITCNSRPSLYSYPPPMKGDKEITPVKLVTAVLSTSNGSKEEEPEIEKEKEEKEVKTVEMEADSFQVSNMSRVTLAQAKFIRFDGRFRVVSHFNPRTISVVIDNSPSEPVDLFDLTTTEEKAE